ncbi:endo alpha-1,4 polygalactosaminidase [Patescibacteria group bacterium]|nr:endo alpha-1,4 polygalactosaminidase [Patescibacteria group bacterium]MBU1673051.1 endo alpha-1,4 polygalactosaminidase [Patescibacteria group bacterium]MBU1963657.1 endo alpha-1,4 polygalactosaminidase [Patescibacteria group bacterium]
MRRIFLFVIILFLLFPVASKAANNWNLSDVNYWAYQIQKLDKKGAVKKIKESKFDMVVLEPTRSDKSTPNFKTKRMVKKIKATDGSQTGVRKRVFAYVDIGEAEEWRWYWQDDWKVGDPDFIISKDPDGWSGNFPVAYWQDEWKDIMIYNKDSALNQVIDDNFDGIYMDWIEAYADPDVKAAAERDGVDPKDEMIAFIKEIKQHARKKKPKFKLIAQNGANLVKGNKRYLNIIDGIAQENITYRGKADVKWHSYKSGNIKNKWRKWDRIALKPYKKAGLPVFSVDYATRKNKINKAYGFALRHGYIPYVSRTPLSRLPKNRPPGY